MVSAEMVLPDCPMAVLQGEVIWQLRIRALLLQVVLLLHHSFSSCAAASTEFFLNENIYTGRSQLLLAFCM